MDLIKRTEQNPFHVLGASTTDSRERLIELQRDMALFGEEQASEEALNALLYPQSRLEAEIRWFPTAEPSEIQKLMGSVKHPIEGQPIPTFLSGSFLARFNAVRLQLGAFPISNEREFSAVIFSLAVAADALWPAQVMEELNRDRVQSGFSRLEKKEEVDSALSGLLRETVQAYLDIFPTGMRKETLLSIGKNFQSEMKNRKSRYHNSYLLDIAADEISLRYGK